MSSVLERARTLRGASDATVKFNSERDLIVADENTRGRRARRRQRRLARFARETPRAAVTITAIKPRRGIDPRRLFRVAYHAGHGHKSVLLFPKRAGGPDFTANASLVSSRYLFTAIERPPTRRASRQILPAYLISFSFTVLIQSHNSYHRALSISRLAN